MQTSFLVLAAALVMAGPGDSTRTQAPGTIKIEDVVISLIDEAMVPAEEAGVLTSLEVKVGDVVEEGQLLAQIDDRQVQAQKLVAQAEQKSAAAQAESNINIEYAAKAAEVADTLHRLNQEANRIVPGSKPKTELQRLALDAERAALQIEQAKLEKLVAQLTAEARKTEVDAADIMIARRKIVSPLSGKVEEVLKHRGEWAQPGETVLHVIRLDRLRLKAQLSISDYLQREVEGRPIVVRVRLKGQTVEEFRGTVTFASSQIRVGGTYEIHAEVENRMEQGSWLIGPGIVTEMTIAVAPPAQAVNAPRRRTLE